MKANTVLLPPEPPLTHHLPSNTNSLHEARSSEPDVSWEPVSKKNTDLEKPKEDTYLKRTKILLSIIVFVIAIVISINVDSRGVRLAVAVGGSAIWRAIWKM